MTTPSKPDLVALADEPLTPIERVRLSLAMSDAGYSFDPGIDDVIELLEAYDRLASQSSSYEAGREALISVRNWLDTQFNEKPSSADLHKQISKLNAAIAALPADGGAKDIQSSDGGVEG